MCPKPLKQKARRAHRSLTACPQRTRRFRPARLCPRALSAPEARWRHGKLPWAGSLRQGSSTPMQSAWVTACALQAVKHGTLRDANLKLGKIQLFGVSTSLTRVKAKTILWGREMEKLFLQLKLL